MARILIKKGKEAEMVMPMSELRELVATILKPIELDMAKLKKVTDRLLLKVADLENARQTLSVDGEPVESEEDE